MVIKHISIAPEHLLKPSIEEINKINWNLIKDERSKRTPVFSSSTSVQIRIHKQPAKMFKDVHEWGKIVETVDHPINVKRFPNTLLLAEWIKQQVNGIKLGRLMIVNLAPGGSVDPHIDKGEYFEVHSRFHIPIITNNQVNFGSTLNTDLGHMKEHNLYQLKNTDTHYVENRSSKERIHLIADIELPYKNTTENFKINFADLN